MIDLEGIINPKERLYNVPEQHVNSEYCGSVLNRILYFFARSKEQQRKAREPIYRQRYVSSLVFKQFSPPEGFSKGSIEECVGIELDAKVFKVTPSDRVLEIAYGDKVLYKVMIGNKAVTFTLDKKGGVHYVIKAVSEELRTPEHFKRAAIEDLKKVRNYVLRKNGLVAENAVPYKIPRPTFKPEPKLTRKTSAQAYDKSPRLASVA